MRKSNMREAIKNICAQGKGMEIGHSSFKATLFIPSHGVIFRQALRGAGLGSCRYSPYGMAQQTTRILTSNGQKAK